METAILMRAVTMRSDYEEGSDCDEGSSHRAMRSIRNSEEW